LALLELVESHMQILEKSIGQGLQAHQDAVQRLAEVPGFGVDSAMQVIAEVGPTAGSFSRGPRTLLLGRVCPGREESAEVSNSNRSPKGNRMKRRVLTQVANAAVKSPGSVFDATYRKLVVRLGHKKAIWAIAHRRCRLPWKILHPGVRYVEYGMRLNRKLSKSEPAGYCETCSPWVTTCRSLLHRPGP